MKHLALIGSSDEDIPAKYLRVINSEVRLRCGDRRSATLSLHSMDAHDVIRLLKADDWLQLTEEFTAAARILSGADVHGLALCGSALNPLAAEVARGTGLPFVNMHRAMAATLEMFRYRRVVLLGAETPREERA